MDDRLLTARQVAEILSVSLDWVYDMSLRGAIPVHRIGRLHRFSARELDAWLQTHRRPVREPVAAR